MHEYTQAAADAIEAGEREFRQRLRVDWNNNNAFDHPLSDLSGYVTATNRDQTLTGAAPDEVMLIEGYAAAKLDVTITGEYEGISLAAHFAPYNGRSVFYREGIALGVTMTYEIAVSTPDGWEWFPQFVGVVRDVSTDRADGTVVLECLDKVERLRQQLDIPPYAMWRHYLQAGLKRSGLVDSSSLIDLAARAGNFTMGPKTRWAHWKGSERGARYGPLLSVPFHGSLLPEHGMLGNDQSFHRTEVWENDPVMKPRAEQYRPGPHGYLALQAVPRGQNTHNYQNYWIDEFDAQAGTLIGTWVIGTWIYWPGINVDENSIVIDTQIRQNHLELIVLGTNGSVEARLRENNGFLAFTSGNNLRMTTPGWYYIEGNYIVENSANYAMRIRINDTYSAENRWSGRNATNVNDRFSGNVRVENRYALSDLYVVKHSSLTTFANFSYDRTPADTARVSWGRNRVTYTLRDDGREAWDVATEVSSAEYGVVFFDEAGRFVFWNYQDVHARQETPQRTFTVDHLESLALRNTIESVRNVWMVTTRTGQAYADIAYDMKNGVPYTRHANGDLLPADFRIPARGNGTFWFHVDDHTININPTNLRDNSIARGEFGPWEEAVPLHAVKSYTGTSYKPQPPNTEQKLTTRNLARLYITNGYTDIVGFVLVGAGQRSEDGQPRFRIEGTMVHENEPYTWTIRDEESIAAYGERVLELDNNFWLQDEFQTREMLSAIVSRMSGPIPVSETVTVPGDPRVQIGDTIQVRDVDGFGESMWLQVYGIKRDYTNSGLTDTYTVEQVTPPGAGVWDSPTYGLWDQSFKWS